MSSDGEVRQRWAEDRVYIFDTTLRDGEQSPGFALDGEQKLLLARQLERLGVEQVPAVGQQFDPAMHEAIGGEESPDVEHDTVTAVVQPGYRLHDRVLRPALVRVAHPVAG